MLSPRLIALVAAPALLLGGCQTLSSLGDHAASTVGLQDDVPRAYTASEVSEAQNAGIALADEPLAARAGASALQSKGKRGRCGGGHVLHPDRHLSGGGGAWRSAASVW
jgi:hypothetical protein